MEININSITEFLGWCTLINFGLLTLSTISIVLFRKFIIRTHSTLFGIKEKKLPKIYFKYLANFKLVVILLNLTPYIALKLMKMY
ncbi:DUF6868 family protein [Halobacteriovorax sp.]|uniref:DUF6868 family protein n=1 Tax=Halobacteriovorax sp. TaxID=2020862 RepID=UPI003AF1F3DD